MQKRFQTADIMDWHPDTPSCDIQFRSFGTRRSFCGKIRTVRCDRDNGLIRQIVKNRSEGEVLVIDGGGALTHALMGDMLATIAMENGWAGAVIFGAIRDTETIDRLNFGIKALGTNPRVGGKTGAGEIDVAVEFGGVTFTPGHYLYSDADGILVAETAYALPEPPTPY